MPFTIGGDWAEPQKPTKEEPKRKAKGQVKVRLVKRKKALLTIVFNHPGTDDELRDLASELKRACGRGGTVKDGQIEIQGDCVKTVEDFLQQKKER